MGGTQLVEQRVERRRLPVDGRPHVDQVAVVVPLEERDVVLVEQREQRVAHVRVGAGLPQVEHLLVPPGRRVGVAAAQHPLRVGAGEVAVEVHHLGLDPEAEVHAGGPHVVDQRVQPVRPDVGVDGPVAEAGEVGAAAAEPAVVEHEPLHAHLGRGVGERGEAGEVVVEVGGLPGVHQHRPRCRQRHGAAQVGVQSRADAVQAVVGVGARRAAASGRSPPAPAPPRRPRAARHRRAGTPPRACARRTTRGRRSTPRGWPTPRRGRTRTRHPGREQQPGVVAGAAVPGLAQVGPDEPRPPLRGALAAPSPGEVEQLGGARRHRQRAPHLAEREVVGAGVGDGDGLGDETLGREREVDVDLPPGLVVAPGEPDGVVAGLPGPRTQQRRGSAGGAGAGEARGAGEPGGRLPHDAPQPRLVEGGVRHTRGVERQQPRGVVRFLERRAPVQHHGHTRRGGREHQAHALPSEMDRRGCGGQPFTAPAVRPRTKNRCRLKNTSIGTAIDTNAPAVRSSVP